MLVDVRQGGLYRIASLSSLFIRRAASLHHEILHIRDWLRFNDAATVLFLRLPSFQNFTEIERNETSRKVGR